MPDFSFLLPVLCVLLAAVLFKRLYTLYAAHTPRNGLLALPGPPSPNLLLGYAWQFWTSDPTDLHEEWVGRYGRTIQYRILAYNCLFTMDTKALGHVLSRDDVYQKPHEVRTFIAQMLGNGA